MSLNVLNTNTDVSGKTLVTAEGDRTVTGLISFNRSGSAPFAVNSGAAKVANLDADNLDGQDGTYYLNLANATGSLNGSALTGSVSASLLSGNVDSKRVGTRVTSVASSATPSPNADTDDIYTVTALAVGATFAAPSGTPSNGQRLIVRVKDNGTARALAWNAAYTPGGVALPTTTVISKILTVLFTYNTDNSLNKWQCVGVAQEQ